MTTISLDNIQPLIPERLSNSYKGSYGQILIIGGSERYGGAAMIAAEACVKSGAGLTTAAVAQNVRSSLRSRLPECMTLDFTDLPEVLYAVKKADTVLIGPGLGLDNHAKKVFEKVCHVIQHHQTLILDADALTLYSLMEPQINTKKRIMTPHLGEWRRLAKKSLKAETEETLLADQKRLETILVIKSSRTRVYFDNTAYRYTVGNPTQATGGMGDCLAGIIAGLSGQLASPLDATLAGVFIHSAIADDLAKKRYVVLPTEIINTLPFYLKSLSLN